jgi:hypothetical protein
VWLHSFRDPLRWVLSGYAVPAPRKVKMKVLARYGDRSGIWVESGTYLGQTSKLLAREASLVITIEPSPDLVRRARKTLAKYANIQLIQGLSENHLPGILPNLSGHVSFWLDGHASGGMTYGKPEDTPIREELRLIGMYLSNWESVCVFVDDFRGFGLRSTVFSDYPMRSELVQWADEHGLNWTIEHDIFVAHS